VTKFPELFAALAAPFRSEEIKVRPQAGRELKYITARVAMNRLDSVLGPENWCDDYVPSENSVLCRLTIILPDGSALTKCDAGGYAGMADSGDDDKSGYSDAFKRSCVKFGVARYLYRDGLPDFCEPPAPAAARAPLLPPRSPEPPSQARPDQTQGGNRYAGNGHGDRDGQEKRYDDRPPRTGKALFAWTKDQEARHEVALLQYLNKWGKIQDYPGRMVDWDADQVANAYQEARRKLAGPRDGEDEVDRVAARDAG
jgi:hypothetical protein